MNNTKSLLQQLFDKNQRDAPEVLRQRLDAVSASALTSIPTLRPDAFAHMTEMLRARFEFCGRWVNAAYGHTWLALEDMASAMNDPEIAKHLEIRRKHFDGHLLQTESWDRLSLFGIDMDENEETLLHWSSDGEPAVVAYVGYQVDRYENLEAFLKRLVSGGSEKIPT